MNVGSLVFGLIAWILPVVSLMRYKQGGHKNWAVFSVMSISACAISLYFQIYYNHHLVTIGDWSALTDSLVEVAAILLIVTILLNAVTLIVYRDRTAK